MANNAVTSAKIKNGEVKAEDLDPSIEIGGGGGSTPNFNLQVTERLSTSGVVTDRTQQLTLTVQCNSDEIVTRGGFETNTVDDVVHIVKSKKQDNGWTATWTPVIDGRVLTVYAECLKVVNEGTAG